MSNDKSPAWLEYAEVVVSVRVRRMGEYTCKEVPVLLSEYVARNLAPLPREREIPFEREARERAVEMINARRRLADQLSRSIAEALVKEFSARDTINGYEPEEVLRQGRVKDRP